MLYDRSPFFQAKPQQSHELLLQIANSVMSQDLHDCTGSISPWVTRGHEERRSKYTLTDIQHVLDRYLELHCFKMCEISIHWSPLHTFPCLALYYITNSVLLRSCSMQGHVLFVWIVGVHTARGLRKAYSWFYLLPDLEKQKCGS
jgi:hypothetical protein